MTDKILAFVCFYCVIICDCQHVVETKYGAIEGEAVPLASGVIINSYLAVPFAKPPLDELRFEAPLDPLPWNDTLQATSLGSACMQSYINSIHQTHFFWTDYSEDCLTMNIYSPQRESQDLMPVMVYIHGGGFTGGANVPYSGYFLAEKDVVAVSINYRLGIFGFAFTGDETIPGNVGLLDQIQALKFIQETIEAFGGDPSRVTLFGHSAGAACIGLLLVSPLAKGLFHGAILQSGNEMAHWAYNTELKDYIYQVADQVDCPVNDNIAMIDCMKTKNARRLINVDLNCTDNVYYCAGFIPLIDGTVIPDEPLKLRESGNYSKVPEMIGINKDDAFLFVAFVDFPNALREGLNRSTFEELLRQEVEIISSRWPDPEQVDDVYEAVKFYYTDWPNVYDIESNRAMLGELYTDYYFGAPADHQAKLHSSENNVYFYIFNKLADNAKRFFPEWTGVYHIMDVQYVFGWPFFTVDDNDAALNHSQALSYGVFKNYTDNDAVFSDLIMTLWTNFAKYGNPTPDPVHLYDFEVSWPQYTNNRMAYINLMDSPESQVDYRQKEYAFWREYMEYLIYGAEFFK